MKPPMLLSEFLEHSVERLPDKVALVTDEGRFTYGHIEAAANALAAALTDFGLQKGDRVAIFLENCLESVISLFAILKAGGAFVMINPTTKAPKIEFILNNCRAKGIISHGRWTEMLLGVKANVPFLRFVILTHAEALEGLPGMHRFSELANRSVARPSRRPLSIDLAAIIYTSGSTGEPKGVTLLHQNMVAASTSITTYLENVEDDIVINVLPLSFDYGLYQVIMAAQYGGTVVLEKSFLYPHRVVELMDREKVTGLPGVPTIFSILLGLEELRHRDFPHLRYITNTGAALPPSHIEQIRKTFPKATLYSMYGLTECKRVTYLPPEELDRRPGSVGKGMPNEEVYLVDGHGRRITEPDVPGELVVRGANVMAGYWENPEATAKRLRPSDVYPWEKVLYTGDIFRMDAEGFLYFVARRDDIIKSRGEKVAPKEVENVLFELAEVAEAAVIGVPDPVLGQAVKAFVVPRDGTKLTKADVLRHCRARLESFAVPTIIELCNVLPKNASGKIDKTALS